MKRYFIVILVLSTFQMDFLGQSNELILSAGQNSHWFILVEDSDIPGQVELIKRRILADTAVYDANQSRSDRVIIQNLRKEEELKKLSNIAEGRIMYIIGYEGRTPKHAKRMNFWWNNWTPTSEILQLYAILKPEKISSIQTIKERVSAKAIYGSKASFGVVMIDFEKKKDYKEFLEIQK